MKNYFIKYFDSDESLLEFFNNNQSYTIVSILEIKVKGHYKVIYYETKKDPSFVV